VSRYTLQLRNGTHITVGRSWAVTRLPNGRELHAHPDEDSAEAARRLGYGDDVAAMTREHDPLHSRLCDWLGMPHSFSLMSAAGCDADPQLVELEEAAVIAVQKFKRAWEISR
jgi:hypothetical protein